MNHGLGMKLLMVTMLLVGMIYELGLIVRNGCLGWSCAGFRLGCKDFFVKMMNFGIHVMDLNSGLDLNCVMGMFGGVIGMSCCMHFV